MSQSTNVMTPQEYLGFLAGGGEMGERTRAFDWSQTPVGPVAEWPQSLKIAVRIMLDSRYAMWLGWGPDFTFFYNDAYAGMTLGPKHPWALGRSAREVWSEIWDDIGPRAESVVRTGEATWDEGLLLFLERRGFPEETYHTFSYSPLPDDNGTVGGMLCVVTEDTQKVIGERRLNTLRELAAKTNEEAKSAEEACRTAARTLAANRHDLPFVLFYLIDPDSGTARLAGASGLPEGTPASPDGVDLAAEDLQQTGWPLALVLKTGRAEVVTGLAKRFGPLPGGLWPEPAQQAIVLPMAKPGQARLAGFVVAGASPRLPFDDGYKGFMDLLAGQVATAVTNARAYEEERRRAEALAELDRAKTTFFSNVSHEFRTPLALMLGPVEDALAETDGALLPPQRERLQVAHRNAMRLQKLVNTLLDFSRIEAGRSHAQYEPTDLAAFTADLASNFRSACEKAGLELKVDCPPLPEPVFVDRQMWEKIILNLLSNAFKFTFQGEIVVSLGMMDHCAQVRVRDTGTGIPAGEMPRLFERFHRVENAHGRTHEGSGIGLALVHELVKLHSGSITATSEVGHGTTFLITLPLGSAHLPQDQIGGNRPFCSTDTGANAFVEEAMRWLPDQAPDHEPSAEMQSIDELVPASISVAPLGDADRPRVLIADDNADMRRYVARLLADQYTVETVPDGLAALAAVHRQPPSLILSDVMMPRLDGFGLLRELRSDHRTAGVPIILLSARAGEESRVEGMQAGADDYLVKPFSSRELLVRVGALLQITRLRREAEQAIRKSEERFRTLFEEMDEGCCVLEMLYDADQRPVDFRFLETNPAFERHTGLKDVVGRTILELVPDHDAHWFDIFGKVAATGETTRFISETKAMGRWFEVYAYRVGGPPSHKVGTIFTDITARKRDEEKKLNLLRELETQNAFIKAVLSQVPAAIVVADADTGQIRMSNEEAHRIVKHDYHRGKRLEDYGTTYIREAFATDGSRYGTGRWPLDRALRGETVVGEEIENVMFDHSRVIVRVNASPIRVGDKIVAAVVAFHDITDRKIAERSARFLADASAALSGLVDYEDTLQRVARLAVPGFADWAVVDMAEEGGAARRLVVASADRSKEELAEKFQRRFSHKAGAASGPANILRTGRAEMQSIITDEMLVAAAQGEEDIRLLRELGLKSFIGVPLKVQGQTLGVLSFLSARPGRHYGEHDLAIANDLASRASIAIENSQLYARLKDANRRKDEFLATLAHELRNPLAPIRNSLQILKMPRIDAATLERSREMMERQVQQLVRLVDDLLDVSRVMRGKIELRKERVELATVVARAVEMVQPLIESQGHEFTVTLPADSLPLDVDPVRMAQVIGNLLTNAAKYTEPNGRIWVTAQRDAGNALLRVRDSGIGIAPDMLPYIFELFVQADHAATRSQGGLGIGLTLVKNLVEMHHGTVAACSAGLGRGSEFVVRLPLASLANGDTIEYKNGESQPELARPSGQRLLVVDDNRDAADSLAMLLRLQGHEVRVANDGVAALEIMNAYRPALVFLDIGMPKMDGYEVARRLRKQPGLENIRLAALTGWGQKEDRRRTAEAGFDHHFVKPVEMEAIEALLAEMKHPKE